MPYDAAGKAAAKAYSAAVRAKTLCVKCGGQPVDFHREGHEIKSNERVAHLVALGFPIERIAQEIAACTPLCRRCHMVRDGRRWALIEARPFKKGMVKVGPKPCIECHKLAKPLRRGLCNRCNHKSRYVKR